jgi:hypothetical protein
MSLCPVKPAVYLTKPAEMRKARLNQPRVTFEQFREQLDSFRLASEKFSESAKVGGCDGATKLARQFRKALCFSPRTVPTQSL